jgi:CheY-specific phosphatase CheX
MQATDHILHGVGKQVLENLSFLLIMPGLGEEPGPPSEDSLMACVKFKGHFSGRLVAIVPKAILSELAHNMLGLEMGEPVNGRQQIDALGELANVITGNVLGKMAGPEPVFNLEPPKIMRKVAFHDTDTVVRLPVDEEVVELRLHLEQHEA